MSDRPSSESNRKALLDAVNSAVCLALGKVAIWNPDSALKSSSSNLSTPKSPSAATVPEMLGRTGTFSNFTKKANPGKSDAEIMALIVLEYVKWARETASRAAVTATC